MVIWRSRAILVVLNNVSFRRSCMSLALLWLVCSTLVEMTMNGRGTNQISLTVDIIGFKHSLFKFLASGSSALMAMTFQSVSPSSIMAKMPRTLTWITCPGEHTWWKEHMTNMIPKVTILRWLREPHCTDMQCYLLICITWVPMSQTSMGSLSPQQFVSLSL